MKSDHSYCSDDSSKSDYSVESDDDLDEEFYNVERLLHKRDLIVPDQEIYDKDLFITKVDIEMLLPFGNIQSSHSTKKNKSRCRIVSTSIIRQDVRSCAIRVANNSIQQGNLRITSAYVDDPLLQDSASFSCSDEAFHWEQGWGRRYNNLESTLYGQNYIDKYKDILVSLFEEGNKDSSKKMNPAMMREQLKKQFPNVFSLPGETDIKKLINALTQNEKKGTRSKERNDNTDNMMVFGNMADSQSKKWKHILKRVVRENHGSKPECIYREFTNEIEKEGI